MLQPNSSPAIQGAEPAREQRPGAFHLEPLDALRFFAALWVLLHHGRKPFSVFAWPDFKIIWDCTFFGQTGVIAFFVISGICIHYPTVVVGKKPVWGAFLVRRFARVLLPYWVVLPLALLTGNPYSILKGGSVAWTLLCELGFYLLYPLLFSLARKIGWIWLCAVASIPSMLMIVYRDQTPHLLATYFNILITLPTWLMGCVIAEKFFRKAQAQDQPPSVGMLYGARLGVLVLQFGVAYLSVLGILYYRYLLIPLGVVVSLWIWMEMCYYLGKSLRGFWRGPGQQAIRCI